MNFRTILFLCSVAFFTHCGGSSSDQPIPTDSVTTPPSTATESQIIIELADGVTMDEALSVISTDGVNPEAEVLIAWDDHIANWEVPAGTVEEQKAWIVEQETLRLEELLSDLEEEDSIENEESAADERSLTRLEETEEDSSTTDVAFDVASLKQTNEAPIGYITVSTSLITEAIQESPSVVSAQTTSYDNASATIIEATDKSDTQTKTITDWDKDASYVPHDGFSKVTASRTYQSFRLDQEAVDTLNAVNGTLGVEIKTLIQGRDNAECGNNWSTNISKKKSKTAYRDTEFLDGWTNEIDFAEWYLGWYWNHGSWPSPGDFISEFLNYLSDEEYRVCGIGVIDAKALEAHKKYWVGRGLKHFNGSNNPQISVHWTPTQEIWWSPYATLWCEYINPTWCRFSRHDMSTQWLVTYNFNDSPRVRWQKDNTTTIGSVPNPTDDDPSLTDPEDPEDPDPTPTPTPTPDPEPTPAPTPDPTYPTTPPSEGQLIKGDASDAIYIMENGYKQHLVNAQTYTTCGFGWDDYITYAQSVVDAVPTGASWSIGECLPSGSLIHNTTTDEIFYLQNGYKRHLVNPETYDTCGFSWSAYVDYSAETVNAIPTGSSWSIGECLPNGSLIRNTTTSEIYYLQNGYKRHLVNPETYNTCGFSWSAYVNYSAETVTAIPTGSSWSIGECLPNGSLIHDTTTDKIYYLENGSKRWIPSASTYASCGFSWSSYVNYSTDTVSVIPTGNDYSCY